MSKIKHFKIGDKVIVVDESNNNLILNEKYTISGVFHRESLDNIPEHNHYLTFIESGEQKYFSYRFDFDLKTSRKKKIEILCQK